MTDFLVSPCQCGWSYEELSAEYRFCVRCGRKSTFNGDYWSSSKPLFSVETLRTTTEASNYQNKEYIKDLIEYGLYSFFDKK